MELENLGGDVKGKGTSGGPTRPKLPMHRPGAHCFVVARKRGNSRGAKGAGLPRRNGVNGKTGGTPCSAGRRQPSLGGHEPDESRGSCPDLWEARGAIPRAYPATGNRVTSNRTEATTRKLPQQPPGDYSHCACSRLYSPLRSNSSLSLKAWNRLVTPLDFKFVHYSRRARSAKSDRSIPSVARLCFSRERRGQIAVTNEHGKIIW